MENDIWGDKVQNMIIATALIVGSSVGVIGILGAL